MTVCGGPPATVRAWLPPELAAAARDILAAASDLHVDAGAPGPDAGEPAALLLCELPAEEPLGALKRRTGIPRVIICAASLTPVEARAVLAQGGDGALAAEDLATALLPAIRAALAGLVTLPQRLGAALEDPALTPREKQVLALVVMGFSNREIAERLIVSESTVKSHLFSAFRRLGVRTRRDAVALITDPSRGFGSGILSIPRS